MSDKKTACLWLGSACFIPPDKKIALLETVGDVELLYEDFKTICKSVKFISEDKLKRLEDGRNPQLLQEIASKAESEGAKIITYLCADYPKALKQIYDYPICLFAKGDLSLLNTPMLAIVGTRRPTRYGESVTEQFASKMASRGITVVSGLAHGVDAIAHNSAIDVGGKTIGVIASGLDKRYPPENSYLYDKMFKEHLIISEYPYGVPPINYRFIERNRIVSGIARGVLVTEAGEKSGSLVTAGFALEQNKNVYCIPGNILSKMSLGTNDRIKQSMAAMVTKSEDILVDYPEVNQESDPVRCSVQLTQIQAAIIAVLERGSVHFEELLRLTELTVPELMSILMQMEIAGLIKKLAGNYYSI